MKDRDLQDVIIQIEKFVENGKSWGWIKQRESEEQLRTYLQYQHKDNCWPNLTIEEWYAIVDAQKSKFEQEQRLVDTEGATIIGGINENNDIQTPPVNEDCAWQTYRRRIARKFGNEAAKIIEDTTFKTLRSLSRDTQEIGAVKGLVIGNVQSGKTANMAALMAMAADFGWNMFIVLSGMMENLRRQTERRLGEDLNDSDLNWRMLGPEQLRSVAAFPNRLRDLNFEENRRNRYMIVCLKNSKRLTSLLDWLSYDPEYRRKLRILIIDDECDQASINTATEEERTAINRLILNLVNNRTSNNENATTPFQAVNYIGYSATPYANLLNEGPREDSLYPKDFIVSLPVSKSYFGPQQIFGYEPFEGAGYSGLDIVRAIPDCDEQTIKDIHDANETKIPESLKDAICWFICGIAYMRHINRTEPVSMMIHTSYQTVHHDRIADSVSSWIESTSNNAIIDRCQRLWQEEQQRFSPEDFREQYPQYHFTDEVEEASYPDFETLRPIINHLLGAGMATIKIDRKRNRLQYTEGLHLCIDNSDRSDDNEIERRLFYPEQGDTTITAPAFLIIGGNTLSRGLTLEGLVSTYFIRPARCADTLMQMGRWFGYRPGYELIPRVWMTADTRDKFEFISEMDQKLRDEIREMSQLGTSPAEYGPKVLASPSCKWLRIVSDNKSQEAVGADYDFSGKTKETGVFDNNADTLNANIQTVRNFLLGLGEPTQIKNNPYASRNVVWREVQWNKVKEFLDSFKRSTRQKDYDISPFTDWMDQMSDNGNFQKWDIVLAGKDDCTNGEWRLSDSIVINKVCRSQLITQANDNILHVGILRSFNDFVSDIDIPNGADSRVALLNTSRHNLAELYAIRKAYEMQNTPLLVFYIIDKDSRPGERRNNERNRRSPLNAVCDVVGYSMYIPGKSDGLSSVKTVHINITSNAESDE